LSRPALELADIFRQFGKAYRSAHRISLEQSRAMRAIEVCRTATLGGHVDRCSHCDQTRNSYNSCRNRHCPKCQNIARAKWLEDRKTELLPVEYFHLVFTLPEQAAEVAFQNPAAVYDILFAAVSETLLTIGKDTKHLGAELGFFAVLHTWGQNLLHHPHLHCVIPGGGISTDRERWIACRPGFFLPVRVLSRLFRRLFLARLSDAFKHGKLRLFSELAHLSDPVQWQQWISHLAGKEWVVYSKPPFGGPLQVIEYLGRYTHRVAIGNHRLIGAEGTRVSFRWKDYRRKGRQKERVMTLDADEFIRRFLIHILPPGFQKIRYYGFLANCHRRSRLPVIGALLGNNASALAPERELKTQIPTALCPVCHIGILMPIQLLAPIRWPEVAGDDTS
jgi:hypothetical protein